ncbi:hypothetical protein ABG768_020447 [Culter alburnus]|uniref:AIG1-type G domain-containing protein n=1 Tax=Culter alburnus TaxID=194366 RepID=A0AAW2B046_CULAL
MRITEHEQQILQMIKMMFGQDVLKYSIILFTRGDLLKDQTIEELINNNNKLRDLVDQCGGRYHVFSNRGLGRKCVPGGAWGGCGFLRQNNREQVNDLLQKIDTMIKQNGGRYYSNEIYEEAERFRQEEEEWREQQEKKKIQEFKRREKERKEKIEKVMKAEEERNRAEEKSSKTDIGAGVGAAVRAFI